MAVQAWSASSVYAAEDLAMAKLPEGELMRRAASDLAHLLAARATHLSEQWGRPLRVLALVGPGNNGADAGFALVELTSMVSGSIIEDVCVVRTADGIHAGAAAALERASIRVYPGADAATVVSQADLVVDGIAGLGGRAGLAGLSAELVQSLPATSWVVAVDVPSGVPADGEWAQSAVSPGTGHGPTIVADETITFGVLKPVHVGAHRHLCGAITVADIGVEPQEPPTVVSFALEEVAQLWPIPTVEDHKYSRGVVGVVGGASTYPGAAVLTAVAAAESGAGMVRVATCDQARAALLHHVPEAVLSEPASPHLPDCQAWVVGPGLVATKSVDHALDEYARRVLNSDAACVVDAGGLALLSQPRPGPTLLTPHAGELAKLATRCVTEGETVTAAMVRAEPVYWSRAVAEKLRATVVLKGNVTYVTPAPDAPHHSTLISTVAPAWLATAGAGDVLAGVCGVLLASQMDPPTAGALAATVTGLAAHRANPGGPVRALRVALALSRVIGTGLSHEKDLHG